MLLQTRTSEDSRWPTIHRAQYASVYRVSGQWSRGWAPHRQLLTLLRIFQGAHRDEQPP